MTESAHAPAKFVVASRENAIAELGKVTFNQRTDTDISDFTLQGRDSILVTRELNAAARALEAVSRVPDQRAARDHRKFLDQQLRTTDSTLEVQRTHLSVFRSQAQVCSSKDKISLQQTTLANVRTRPEELAADRQGLYFLAGNGAGDEGKGRSDRVESAHQRAGNERQHGDGLGDAYAVMPWSRLNSDMSEAGEGFGKRGRPSSAYLSNGPTAYSVF